MKSNTNAHRFAGTLALIVAGVCSTGSVAGQTTPSRLDTILAKLAAGTAGTFDIHSLESERPDARTLPALRQAFAKASDKEMKQRIAATLLRLGDSSALYFGYLADFANSAVDDPAPIFLVFDAEGKTVRGQMSPEFLEWCVRNQKEPDAEAQLQSWVYPGDLLLLAQTNDHRADAIFRKGLDSPNPMVVALCVQGLGRLQDISAIPLIVQVAGRLPAGARYALAMELPWFSSTDAERLFRSLVSDSGLRDGLRAQVQHERQNELNVILQRNGQAPRR